MLERDLEWTVEEEEAFNILAEVRLVEPVQGENLRGPNTLGEPDTAMKGTSA